MADEMSAQVKISAEIEGLKKGLAEAQSAMKNASANMSGALAGVQGAFSKFNVAMIAVGSGLAAGGFFQSAIDKSVDLQKETAKLARQMGVTAEEALGLRYAIGDLYISTDAFNGAIGKLTMGVQDGGDKFAKMGVNVKDANGNLKPMKDILLEVNKRINEFKEGADKNAAAAFFYGRSWQEVAPILKLTQDAMDAGSQKAKELGIALDPEAVSKYRAATNDAEDATEAFQIKIGQALLPSVTSLIVYFANNATPIINGVVVLFKGFISIVDGLVNGFSRLWIIAKGTFEVIWEYSKRVSETMTSLAKNGIDAAMESWNKGSEKIAQIQKDTQKEYEDSEKDFKKRMTDLWSEKEQTPRKENTSSASGETFKSVNTDADKEEAKRAMKEYENGFAKFKENLRAKNGEFYEISKQEELNYWLTCLANANTKGKEYEKVRTELDTKVRDLQHEARKEDLNKEIEALKFKASLDSESAKTKADVYTEIFNKISELYKTDTAEYRQALLDKKAADKEYLQKKIEIETETAEKVQSIKLSYLDREENDLEAMNAMGLISDEQKLQKQLELEERRYNVKLEMLQKEAELNKADVDKTRQINTQIETLQQEHGNRVASIYNNIRIATFAPFKSMYDSLESSLSSSLQKMMQGTMSFSTFVKGIIPTIGTAFAQMAAQMAAKWIMEHTVMAAYNAIFGQQQVATAAEVALANVAARKVEAVGAIPALTEIGAMGAFASQASIPIVGPELGAAAYAAAQALGASSLAIASASGGFDIPTGINPMTQLHQEEMVLPAHIANPLRESLASGGMGGGATNINISAIDAKSIKSLFMEHGSSIVASLKKQNRAFAGQ